MKENATHEILRKDGFLGQRMIVLPENIIEDVAENPLIQPLYLTDVGYFPHAQYHYRERSLGSDQYILIHCIEGMGSITINQKEFKLIPNSFCIIPKHTPHKYLAEPDNPWSIYWLHFKGSKASHLYHKYCHNGEPCIKQIPLDENRNHLFDGMMDILEMGYSMEHLEYININLWHVLSSFLYPQYFESTRKHHLEEDVISASIRFMQNNLDKPLAIKDLADRFHYSTSYFFTLFKKRTGYAPINYFNHIKVQKGCQYLSFSNISIKEICYKLGFEDPLYFSRLFKKVMGISPSQYRETYKEYVPD